MRCVYGRYITTKYHIKQHSELESTVSEPQQYLTGDDNRGFTKNCPISIPVCCSDSVYLPSFFLKKQIKMYHYLFFPDRQELNKPTIEIKSEMTSNVNYGKDSEQCFNAC